MYYSLILLYCFLVLSHYTFFRIFDLFIISPVEDCSSSGRKLVSFYVLSQRTFLNFLTCFILAVALRYFHISMLSSRIHEWTHDGNIVVRRFNTVLCILANSLVDISYQRKIFFYIIERNKSIYVDSYLLQKLQVPLELTNNTVQ